MLKTVVIVNIFLIYIRALEDNFNISDFKNETQRTDCKSQVVNCSSEHSNIDNIRQQDYLKLYDSTGRFIRASIVAVIFLSVVIIISLIVKYKSKPSIYLTRLWQFRYRKYSDTDTVYMVENDANLTENIHTNNDETEGAFRNDGLGDV
jgi:hypothetical protein